MSAELSRYHYALAFEPMNDRENCYNEIILDPKGNTYVGELANRFVSRLKLPPIFKIDDAGFHVFEVLPDDRVVHRASQPTRLLAQSYMNPDRVCVYRR